MRSWWPGCLPGIVLGLVGPLACLRCKPPSWLGLLGWAWLVEPGSRLPRQLVLRGRCSDRVPDKRVAQTANPRAASASRRALPDPWTSRGGPQAATAGIPVVAFMGPASGPVSAPESTVTGFPSLFFLLRCPYGPGPARSALWEFLTRPAERGARWTDPREREFPTGREPAGWCRRHLPGTSPGGWHAARRQMNRVQICTPCRLRRAGPADEGNLLHPGPAQPRSWPATQPYGDPGGMMPRAKGLPKVRIQHGRLGRCACRAVTSAPGCVINDNWSCQRPGPRHPAIHGPPGGDPRDPVPGDGGTCDQADLGPR